MSETRGPWLKWAWRHYVMEVDDFPSFEEAVSAACYMSDAGEESLDCIEGPDGKVDRAIVDAKMREIEQAQDARESDGPRPSFAIKLASPDGALAWYDTYTEKAERDAAAEKLRAQYGDRVKVGRVPW